MIAMLAIPAAIAGTFTKRLSVMILLAILICGAFSFFGTLLSFHLDYPPGATIALLASICYILNFIIQSKSLK